MLPDLKRQEYGNKTLLQTMHYIVIYYFAIAILIGDKRCFIGIFFSEVQDVSMG